MKVRADEHVSPKIVQIVHDIALTLPFDLTSVFKAGHQGTEDQYWVTAFAEEGGTAIISADKDFFKKPHQVVAIDNTGLMVVYLPPKWANAPGYLQTAHILMWWPRIERKLGEAKPREFWATKWNIREDGDLERKKVDYGAFRKKLKKSQRRTN